MYNKFVQITETGTEKFQVFFSPIGGFLRYYRVIYLRFYYFFVVGIVQGEKHMPFSLNVINISDTF